jgi:Peptidase family M48
MQRLLIFSIAAVAALAQGSGPPPAAASAPGVASNAAVDRLLDRMVEQEHYFLARMKNRAPLIETYVQEIPLRPAAGAESRPDKDHYFLGRFRLGDSVGYEKLIEHTDPPPKPASSFAAKLPFPRAPKPQPMTFLPRGFAQMTVLDLHDFNRTTYHFDYVRREFLGEVRCLVFDVSPLRHGEAGRFTGRVWIEDRDDNVVRFDGIYVQAPTPKGAVPEHYFHFDSWRVSVAPGEWVPAEIYVEEEPQQGQASAGMPRFKAQARIWDYNTAAANKLDELTSILVDSQSGVKDQAASEDTSPLENERSWERQAEDNILTRLERGGLLAPAGPVDDVLNTVVNNLIVSAGLNVDAQCRVLLTTPIETFSVGHTIVISRGLIDVLPDEASLALVLAAELAHVALGHPTPTQYAFHNQTMLSDAELLQRFHFERTPRELSDAAKKTIAIMRASPYQNTANAGLFLKALASRGPSLPNLLAANLGNQVANVEALSRLAEFAVSAPALDENKIEQIAALPLGSRVKLNPWNNHIELVKAKPLALLSPREKMPFEVTPFVLHLTRVDQLASTTALAQP